MSNTQQALHRLAKPVKQHLLPLLQESIRICLERHLLGEGRGADNFSFYTDVWSFPARLFKDRVEEAAIPFELVSHQGCVMSYEEFQVRHHRVGYSERDNIHMSFPHNASSLVSELNFKSQLALDFGDDFPPPEAPIEVVLAYMANPQDGLCAIYLAIPGRVENGKIISWEATLEIWRRGEPVQTSIDLRLPPEADIEELPLPLVQRVCIVPINDSQTSLNSRVVV